MSNIGALRTSISLDSAQFKQSMQGVNRQLRGLKQEQKAVTSTGTGFARGVDELRKKSDVLNRTLKLQKGQVGELKRRYDESKKATGENSKETQNANAAYQKAKAGMNKTENALKGVTSELEKQSNPWNKLSRDMENTGKKMQDVGRGMSTVGRKMTTRVTAPILGIGAGALKVGMDFEKGMSQVQAISGATGDDLETLSDMAKEMGSTTKFSATDAAGGMEFLAMAGFETNQIIETMPGLLDLAASSNLDLGRAADIATNVLSGFGYEADQAGRLSDVLAKGASTANTSVEQLGGAMETVAPIASMLDLDIEGLTAAVGKMSDAGIQGQKAGRQLRQGMLRLSDPTGKAADLIEELGVNVFDSEGNMKEMDEVVGELNTGLEGMDSKSQAAALSTIFGSESTAGWSALLDVGADELKDYTKELQDSEGAASDMADTMQDNAKGGLTEFKSALEGAGIALSEHMLPAFTGIIEKGTDLVRKFSDLDDSTQKNIIKMGLFAAAIGPVALVAGNLTTAVGGLFRVGSSLVGLLSGTGGLIARLGMLGMGGPVGLAVAGVGLLGAGIYALTRDKEKLHDINYDVIEQMSEEVDATDELIEQYEKLEEKNRLSTDEVLRYMDVLTELEDANGEEALKRLTDEQTSLLEKSGLTNDEMEEFLSLNGQVIEKSPDVVKAISNEGNAYATNIDALKELNEEKRNELLITSERELLDALENETTLLKEQKSSLEDINEIDKDISDNRNDRLEKGREINIEEEKLKGISEEILGLRENMDDLEGEALIKARSKLGTLENQEREQSRLVAGLHVEEEKLKKTYNQLVDKLNTKNDDLDITREELRKIDQLQGEYEGLILSQAGITAEKGRGAEKIDEQIKKLEREKKELDEINKTGRLGTEEYNIQNRALSTQLGRLRDAQTELKNVNDLAGKTIYNKRVNISTDPDIYSLNSMLSTPINKKIQLQGHSFRAMAYADGTDYHPGGLALAGEEGPELARLGNKWSMLDYGFTDLPRGTEVFTHDESNKIMRSLNNMPAYAGGTNMGAETNRIVNQVNEPESSSAPMVFEIHVTSELDGRKLGKSIANVVTNEQDRGNYRRRRLPHA